MSTAPASVYSRKNPFPAALQVNRKMNGEGSEKETRHFEFSLAGSGLGYEPGDSMGVFVRNDPKLVEELLHALHLTGDEPVSTKEGETFSLREGLLRYYGITQPSRQFLEAIVERAADPSDLRELLGPDRKADLERYLWGMEIIDFLLDSPSIRFTPEEFTATLRKLQPRLYSIASSLKARPEQVDFVIATVRYESHGRARAGVATSYLADRVQPGETVPMFVHVAKGFRLPEDPATPIIMVGPGTGVAPFRAYLQERAMTGATGKNWLFFGEQRLRSDFLYEEELKGMVAKGVLTRFDTAFSRDEARKVYVQHRLEEHAKDVYAWLEEGAHFYVCGDAARMAKDVDVALHRIVETQGGKSPEGAAEYVETMRKGKRYKRDVY